MEKVQVSCDFCGTGFTKLKTKVHNHNFCCRDHFYQWNSVRISKYNSIDNPMNKSGGVFLSRIKKSEELRGKGEGKAYRKFLGKHVHRSVAEWMLGRSLLNDEIVHHIDGNKLNNSPENLMVMSKSEHSQLHAIASRFGKTCGKGRKAGDINKNL